MPKLPTPEQLAGLDPDDHITRDYQTEFARMARASLFFFARYIFGCTGLNERAHKSLCDFAAHIIRTPKAFGVCEDPRGTGKSHAVTIPGPAWALIQDPAECERNGWLPLGATANIAVVSYKTPFAQIFTNETRKRMSEQPLFLWLFGDLIPENRDTAWSKEFFTVNRGTGGTGYSVMALGTESGSTSLHPHVLFIDDLINEINYKSVTEVASQVEWMSHSENLVEITRGSRLVTQNEWSERGVNAGLRELNVSNPRSIAFFSRSRIVCDTCENGRPVDRFGNPIIDGEYLSHPSTPRPLLDHYVSEPFGPYTLDDVKSLKARLPATIWWAQHENNPLARSERRWQTDWLRWYTIEDDPVTGIKSACMLTGSGGLSGNSKTPDPDRYLFIPFKDMDVTVALDPGEAHPGIAVTGRVRVPQFGELLFILDCSTGQLNARDQFFRMFDWTLKWGARRMAFEKVGLTGYIATTIPAMAEAYTRETGRQLPFWIRRPNLTAKRIIGVTVNVREGDKRMRIDSGISPYAEQRLLACRRDITHFLSEYEIFDKGKHMDGLDSVLMCIKASDIKRQPDAETRGRARVFAETQKAKYLQDMNGAVGYGEGV